MGLNVGYLTAEQTKESDEKYTPYYAVDPILKYIPDGAKVWTPFDREWSAFYQSLKNVRGGESKSYALIYRMVWTFLIMSRRSMIT